MNNKNFKLLLSAGLLGITAANAAFASEGPNIDEIISDQRSRQIARQISGNITSRIASDINPTLAGPNTENPKGASADRNSWMPDSLWSSFSWSRISDDSSNLQPFDANLYQTTTGIDKNIGKFYFGATLTYAGATIDTYQQPLAGGFTVQGSNGSTHSVNVTPYVAYVINKNLFLSAMSGYSYSNSSFRGGFSSQSVSDNYTSELDLNGLHVVNQWFMKGKIGARYGHSYSTSSAGAGGFVTPQLSTNADIWTYLTDVEGGYAFKNGIRLFTGVLYE